MFRIIGVLFRRKSNTTADECSGKPIPVIPLDIFQNHILNKLDGVTLASTICASPQLFSLCNDDDKLWRKICNSTWPSTADPRVLRAISANRSFYSDSFLSTSYQLPRLTCLSDTSELISAVDIYYKDQVICSKVLQTETVSVTFFCNPLQLQLLGPRETVPTSLKYDGDEDACMALAEEHLRVSWIVIDPYNKRAVNVASHKAVDSEILSFFHKIHLHYATVATVATGKLVQFAVRVTCGWMGRELHVKGVTMEIKDAEKTTLNGRESMGILQAAMEGRRRRIDSKTEKDNYKKFSREKADVVPIILVIFFTLYIVFVIIIVMLTLCDGNPDLIACKLSKIQIVKTLVMQFLF